MKVAAVVVTYNRKELLRENLKAILGQTHPVDRILVVNNASTDGTLEMLRREFPTVEVLTLPRNLGGAGGFKAGLERVRGWPVDFAWVMDDDVVPKPEALDKLLAATAEREYAALGSVVWWKNGKRHPMNTPWRDLRRPFLKSKHGRPVYWLSFVSVLIPKKRLSELPNEKFFVWNDDIEYFTRISRDAPLLEVRKSQVYHLSKTNYTPALGQPERYYYQVRNRLWLAKAPHLRGWEKLIFLLHFLGELAVFLFRNPLRGWTPVLRGLRDGLFTSPYARRG